MSNSDMNNDLTKDFAKALYDEKESREKAKEEKKKKESNKMFFIYVIVGVIVVCVGLYLLDILWAIADKF